MVPRITRPEPEDYLLLGGPDRRWRPSAQPVIVGVLLLEALLAGAWAAWPPAETNRGHDATIALLIVAVAAVCMIAWRRRGPLVVLEACLVLTWIAPLFVIMTRQLEASQVLWAAVVILIAAVTAFYLPRRPAVLQVAVLTVAYLVSALAFEPRTRPLIAAAVVICIVAASGAVARMRRDRDRMVVRISEIAVTDPLTGLLNRRGLEAQAGVVHANALRSGQDTIVALIDIDGLKAINDRDGHEAGDALIRGVSDHWRASLREGDLLARVGGDEFVIILPNANVQAAGDLLTRIRSCAPATWSHGWSLWNPGEPLDAAIARADALMYVDKAERRASRG